MDFEKEFDIVKIPKSKIAFPLRAFSREELFERASLRVARVVREMLEETGSSHSRLLEAPLLPDILTEIGRSVTITEGGWREHVIPCRVIIYEIHRMFANAESDESVAQFIREHVMIVRVSDEERRRLDSRDSKLKQRMPKDWEFGHDKFDRFLKAGIKFERYKTL